MVPALWTTTGQTSPVTHFEVVRQCSSILLPSDCSPQPPDNVQQNHNTYKCYIHNSCRTSLTNHMRSTSHHIMPLVINSLTNQSYGVQVITPLVTILLLMFITFSWWAFISVSMSSLAFNNLAFCEKWDYISLIYILSCTTYFFL